MHLNKLFIIIGLTLSSFTNAQIFYPSSFTVPVGTFSGQSTDLTVKNDSRILELYSSTKALLDARFSVSLPKLKARTVNVLFTQNNPHDVFVFQVKNTSGIFIEIGRTTGSAGVAKSLAFDVSNLSLSLTSVIIRVTNLAKTVVDDSRIDYLSVTTASDLLLSSKIPVGSTWYWQLQGALDLGREQRFFGIDLFDTSAATIAQLKSMGKKVICYFSAGSFEDWRPDASKFPVSAIGNDLSGWAGESWLDVRNTTVRAIMKDRILLAKAKGCDGVDPDNVDGYTNPTGFPLTSADQLSYNRYLSTTARGNGLLVGLKNSAELVGALVNDFDFSVVESCSEYGECLAYTPFIENNKAVFQAEYSSYSSDICSSAARMGFSAAFYSLALDGSNFQACR